MPQSKRIAVWLSDKKLQKMNWQEFEKISNANGFEIFRVNMDKSLQSQQPFSVLLHKLTDIIASASFGDIKLLRLGSVKITQLSVVVYKVLNSSEKIGKQGVMTSLEYLFVKVTFGKQAKAITALDNISVHNDQCRQKLEELETYIDQNPNLIVIDPLPNVKKLLDRYSCYTTIHSTDLHTYNIFTPNFCTLDSNDLNILRQDLKAANVTYPFICKPVLGQAHEMSIIFNEKCLVDVRTPCVAQSFIKHDAVLYKIFIIGDRHCCVERPSLKNFEACDSETIYFDSSDVSRANSTSSLTVLDPEDLVTETSRPDDRIINIIASTLRKAFSVELLGVDIIAEKGTGRFAVIDANSYPGYDGYSDYYEALIECISKKFTLVYT